MDLFPAQHEDLVMGQSASTAALTDEGRLAGFARGIVVAPALMRIGGTCGGHERANGRNERGGDQFRFHDNLLGVDVFAFDQRKTDVRESAQSGLNPL